MAHAWIRGQLTPERPQRGCQLDGRLPIAGRMKIGRLGTGYRVLVRPVPAVRSEELPTGRSGSVSCSGFGALRHCHQHCHDPVRHCPRLSGRPLFSGPWGGGGRIRTLDGLPPSGFQNRCNRPLCHASFQPAAPLTDADFTEQFTYHGVLAPASAWRDLVVPRHTTAPAAHFHGTRAPNSPTAPSSCARSRPLALVALELGRALAARVRRRRADLPALRRPTPSHRAAHRPHRRAQDPRPPRAAHRTSTVRAGALARTVRLRLSRRPSPRRARSSPATRAGE